MSNSAKTLVELDLMNTDKQVFQGTAMASIITQREYEPSAIYKQKQSFSNDKKMEEGKDAENMREYRKLKDGDTVEKLKAFFDGLQKQHPESHLELQYRDGGWKVWCGACKKFLRPDKSGKALHNIQRQHFSSSRHKKNLHLMLQAEDEAKHRKLAVKKEKEPRQ